MTELLTGHQQNLSASNLNSQQDASSSLRIITCGSVDDGKSTLIGRLLWDSDGLPVDQREELRESSKSSHDGQLNFSSLLDGLTSEREQGITIDVAWRYFDTAQQRLVFIDSPGHEQYIRNMACGASHADIAVILIDARHGIKIQTRRHLAILDFMSVRRLIIAVNKMDLVDWSENTFSNLEAELRSLIKGYKFSDTWIIPTSALYGANIVTRAKEMPWYSGPTFSESLRLAGIPQTARETIFRMPVQLVVREGEFRGLAGTVASGAVGVGDKIIDTVGDQSAHVARILTMDRELQTAISGQAVILQLDQDIDISRGSLLAHHGQPPHNAEHFIARIVWLSDKAFSHHSGYLIRTATDMVPVRRFQVKSLSHTDTFRDPDFADLPHSNIFDVDIQLSRPVVVDKIAVIPETARFIIVDSLSGASVGAGIVSDINDVCGSNFLDTFVLSREQLRSGICADLADEEHLSREFRRRADEAAILLNAAGVRVRIELDEFN